MVIPKDIVAGGVVGRDVCGLWEDVATADALSFGSLMAQATASSAASN